MHTCCQRSAVPVPANGRGQSPPACGALPPASMGTPRSGLCPAGVLAPLRPRQVVLARAASVEVEPSSPSRSRNVEPDETYARNALANAERKIDALSQQAEVVEELKKHMAAQDALVARLTADLEAACEAKAARKDAHNARIAELETQLDGLELPEGMGDSLPPMSELNKQLEEQETLVTDLNVRVAGVEADHAELHERAQAARKELREVSALMVKARAASEPEPKSKKLRGFGKRGKGGKGAKGQSPSTKSELAELQWQVMTTRQALDKANAELASLRAAAAERSGDAGRSAESLARAQADADVQASALEAAEKEIAQLQLALDMAQKLKETAADTAAEAAVEQALELRKKIDDIKSEIAGAEASAAAARMTASAIKAQAAQNDAQLDLLRQECDELEAARRECDANAAEIQRQLDARKADPVAQLQESLQEMSVDMDEAIGLRSDLQVLAEAFEAKEAEATEIGAKGKELNAQMEAMEDELIQLAEAQDKADKEAAAALEQVEALSSQLEVLESENAELKSRNAELEESARTQGEVATVAEEKALSLEAKLVKFSEEIMALKGDLSSKQHDLTEAGQLLKLLTSEEASATATVEATTQALAEQTALADAQSAKVDELGAELETVMQAVAELHSAEEALQATSLSLTQYKQELEDARASVTRWSSDRTVLEERTLEELEKVSELMDMIGAANQAHEVALSEVQRELEDTLSKVDDMRAAAAQSLDSVLTLAEREKQAVLIQALNDAKEHLTGLRTQLRDRDLEHAGASEEAARLRDTLAAAETRMEQCSEDLVAAKAELESMSEAALSSHRVATETRAALAQLEEELGAEAARTRELLEQAEVLAATRDNHATACADAASRRTELEAAVSEARERAADTRKRADALRVQASRLGPEVEAARAQAQAAVKSNDARKVLERVETVGTELEGLVAYARELEKTLRSKDEQIAALSVQAGRSARMRVDLGGMEEAEQLARRLAELQAENGELQAVAAQKAQLLSQAKAFLRSRAEATTGAANPE